jgi:hypothetical protein
VLLRLALAALLALAVVPRGAIADAAPALAIYSYAVSNAVPPAIGAGYADAVAAEIGAAGGVTVVRGASSLTPTQYRNDAKSHDADYYVTGSVAAIGSTYSVLSELVNTRNGLIVWTSTVMASSVADLRGQGAGARQAFFDQIGHASFHLSVPAPAPAPSVTIPLAPVPAPSPTPVSTFAVVSFGGSALPSDRAFAVRSVLENLRKRGLSAAAQEAVPNDLHIVGAQDCMDTGAATIVGGSLETTRLESQAAPPATTAVVTLQIYDCRTQHVSAKPLTSTATTPISTDAIRAAVDAAITAYF